MREAAFPAPRLGMRLWQGPGDQAAIVARLLDAVGDLLHTRSLEEAPWLSETEAWSRMTGSEAFRCPLALGASGACMQLDHSKVKRARYFKSHGRGYAYMVLAGSGSAQVVEGVHRFVLWAMFGPPSPSIGVPVLMHTCHDPSCVSPLHMVWGEHLENTGPPRTPARTPQRAQRLSADAHASSRITQRGMFSMF